MAKRVEQKIIAKLLIGPLQRKRLLKLSDVSKTIKQADGTEFLGKC